MERFSFLDKKIGLLKDDDVCFDENIAMINRFMGDHPNPGSVKLEWVVIVAIQSGKGECRIEDKTFTFKERDLAFIMPGTNLTPIHHSDDMDTKCLCVSKQYVSQVIPFYLYNFDVMAHISKNPIFHLEEEEFRHFALYYELLLDKIRHPNEVCYKESVQHLMKAFLYDFYAVIGRQVEVSGSDFTQGRILFKRFLELLHSNFPKWRSVSQYATQLNVTPKYLSVVCKQYSDRTASQIISQAVMKDITEMLSDSNKSIKEIMVDLDFPSLSFFGKYVKKHLGMGPKEYRAKMATKS